MRRELQKESRICLQVKGNAQTISKRDEEGKLKNANQKSSFDKVKGGDELFAEAIGFGEDLSVREGRNRESHGATVDHDSAHHQQPHVAFLAGVCQLTADLRHHWEDDDGGHSVRHKVAKEPEEEGKGSEDNPGGLAVNGVVDGIRDDLEETGIANGVTHHQSSSQQHQHIP